MILDDYPQKHLNLLIQIIEKLITPDDIIVLLGDNFYPYGISSVDDKLWNKFTDYFKNIKNNIYPLLGNHDYLVKSTSTNSIY